MVLIVLMTDVGCLVLIASSSPSFSFLSHPSRSVVPGTQALATVCGKPFAGNFSQA